MSFHILVFEEHGKNNVKSKIPPPAPLGAWRGEFETSDIFTVDKCLFSFDPLTCGAVERCKDV
jgi:hypothetical protein